MQLVPLPGGYEPQVTARLDVLETITAHLNGNESAQFRRILVASCCARLSLLDWESAVGRTIEQFNAWSNSEAQASSDASEAPPLL